MSRFLFGSSAPQPSFVEQLGASTLRYRTTREDLVRSVTATAFGIVVTFLNSFSASHVENTATFTFLTNVRGFEQLSVTERDAVASNVAVLLQAQNVTTTVSQRESPANGTIPATNVTITMTWPVPVPPVAQPPVVPEVASTPVAVPAETSN